MKTTSRLKTKDRLVSVWTLSSFCSVDSEANCPESPDSRTELDRQNVDESSSLGNSNMSWTVFLFTGWNCWSMLSSPVKCFVWPPDFHLTLTNYILPNQFNVAVCCGKDKRNLTEHLVSRTFEWALSIFLRGTSSIHAVFRCVFKEPSCSAPLLEQTRKLTHHALLKTVPYNSCHRITRWVRWRFKSTNSLHIF